MASAHVRPRDHVEFGVPLKKRDQPLPNDLVVIDDQEPHGSVWIGHPRQHALMTGARQLLVNACRPTVRRCAQHAPRRRNSKRESFLALAGE